jgi:glycerol-3-phosphate acyltransferase PlsY
LRSVKLQRNLAKQPVELYKLISQRWKSPSPVNLKIYKDVYIMIYLFVIISYLIGSIPTGVVLAKMTGAEDIRKSGSGNIGATNVTRLLGKKLGVLTLVGDVLKAVLPMLAE